VKHFSDELWADFVRNLAPATTAQAMQKHIEDGCRKCEAVLKGWQSVFRIAQAESGFSPPEDAIRIAKAQFAAVSSVQQRRPVRLVFDSNLTSETRAAQGLKVRLLQRQQAVSDTTTNQHGEFQLEFDAGADMCLSIGHEQDRMVVLPIYGVHSGLGILKD